MEPPFRTIYAHSAHSAMRPVAAIGVRETAGAVAGCTGVVFMWGFQDAI